MFFPSNDIPARVQGLKRPSSLTSANSHLVPTLKLCIIRKTYCCLDFSDVDKAGSGPLTLGIQFPPHVLWLRYLAGANRVPFFNPRRNGGHHPLPENIRVTTWCNTFSAPSLHIVILTPPKSEAVASPTGRDGLLPGLLSSPPATEPRRMRPSSRHEPSTHPAPSCEAAAPFPFAHHAAADAAQPASPKRTCRRETCAPRARPISNSARPPRLAHPPAAASLCGTAPPPERACQPDGRGETNAHPPKLSIPFSHDGARDRDDSRHARGLIRESVRELYSAVHILRSQRREHAG